MNLLHTYTNIAVADVHTHNFNDIHYYHDVIHYRNMLQYYRDSHTIGPSSRPNAWHSQILLFCM